MYEAKNHVASAPSGEEPYEQFMIGKKACEQAKTMGADIALFPEMWSSGYCIPQGEKAVTWMKEH